MAWFQLLVSHRKVRATPPQKRLRELTINIIINSSTILSNPAETPRVGRAPTTVTSDEEDDEMDDGEMTPRAHESLDSSNWVQESSRVVYRSRMHSREGHISWSSAETLTPGNGQAEEIYAVYNSQAESRGSWSNASTLRQGNNQEPRVREEVVAHPDILRNRVIAWVHGQEHMEEEDEIESSI